MRVVVRTVSWVLAVAVVGAAAVSWFLPPPEVEPTAAAAVAEESLAAAGYDAEVAERPTAGVHESADGEVVDVWVVLAEVDVDGTSETVELRVQRSDGRLVYIDDRIGPDDTGRLLTDREFEVVGGYEVESARDRWILENGLGSAGAAVIVATCVVLARRTDSLLGAP